MRDKEVEPVASIHIQTTPDIKTRYVWQAKAEGMTLGEWILKHMNAVCDAAGTPTTEQSSLKRGK